MRRPSSRTRWPATCICTTRSAGTRSIHRADHIELWRLEPAFLDALAPHIDRNTRLELVRNDGQLYVTIGDTVLEGTLTRCPLLAT